MEPRAPKRRTKKKVWRKVSRIAPQEKVVHLVLTVEFSLPTFIGRVWVEVGWFPPMAGHGLRQSHSWLWHLQHQQSPFVARLPIQGSPWLWMVVVVGYVSSRMCWRSDKCYCWWKKSGDHHLGCIQPCKQWNKLPINWCRISSINSGNGKMIHTPRKKVSKCWFLQVQKVFSRSPHLRSGPGCRSTLCSFRSAKTCLFHPFLVDRCWKVSPKKVPSATTWLIFFCGAEV